MNQPVSYSRIALDLYWVQLTWTFWFLGIFFFVNIVRTIFGMKMDSFFSGAYIASNIYMFIVGIIAINFLSYYVENGVTRKTYFFGNVLASLGLSITIPILSYLISLIEKIFFNRAIDFKVIEETLNEVVLDLDGHFLGDIVVSFVLAPYIDINTNAILSFSLFAINIFVFYIVGWLISAAFYRLGVILGLIMIAVGIGFIAIKDTMLRLSMDTPIFKTYEILSVIPKGFAIPVLIVTILITFWIIYMLVKRAPVKM